MSNEFPYADYDRWKSTEPDYDYNIREDVDKYEGDDYDEGGADYDFENLHGPEDAYLDAAYEDRYYLPEPDFDYL